MLFLAALDVILSPIVVLPQLGFSSGDGTRHYTLPGTDKVDGRLTLEQTSNVNVPGRWVFRVDATNVQPAGGANG